MAFLVTAGPCARCEMVCGDPATGERSGPEPLLTLASFRRERAAINFGVLLGGVGGRSGEDGGRGASDSGGDATGSGGGGGGGDTTDLPAGGGCGDANGAVLRVGMPVAADTAPGCAAVD